MRRRLRIGVWALALVVLTVALVLGLSSHKSPSKGRTAPALPSEHLSGPTTTLAKALHAGDGRPTLVLFWAGWCGPCKQEAPAIEQFANSSAGRGRIIGVDWSDGRSDAEGFIHQYGWTFTNLRDAEGTVGNDYRLRDLPTTFVLDPQGRISRTLIGPQTVASLTHALALKSS